jgi:hypothetical protein
MEYTIEYFASPDDSVRVILHEWNVAQDPNLKRNYGDSENSDSTQSVVAKTFESKFINLDSTLTALLGKSIVRDIKSNFLEETERDDVKWVGNQLSAYLLMFKRDTDIYRQIRLIVYPK